MVFLSLVCCILPSFLFAAPTLESHTESLAANFTLLDLENKQVALSDFKNKSLILFFWTTWCPFCRSELKILNNMYERIVRDGLELLAINVGEPFYKVDNFTKRYNFNFKVLLDKDTEVADAYGVLGVPTYIFIDKDGYILSQAHSFSEKLYKKLISP